MKKTDTVREGPANNLFIGSNTIAIHQDIAVRETQPLCHRRPTVPQTAKNNF